MHKLLLAKLYPRTQPKPNVYSYLIIITFKDVIIRGRHL